MEMTMWADRPLSRTAAKYTLSIKLFSVRWTLVTIITLFWMSYTFGSEGEGVVLTEKAAVQAAIENNPNLAQIQERYKALMEVPSQVGTLPDPVVSVNAMNFPVDTFDRDQEGMTQIQLGFSQTFPFPGKLALKQEAAEYDAIAAGHSVDEARLSLVSHVRMRWWNLYYNDRALETVASNKALLRQFITVAETKYETGKGLQQDVLLAQLELSRLLDQEIQLQARRRQQVISLNILMDESTQNSIDLPMRVSHSLPRIATEPQLFEIAEKARPRIKQMEIQVDAAYSRVDLAKRDYYPDFKLGVAYGDRTGYNPTPKGDSRSDLFSVMLGVKIPLYAGTKQSRAVEQKTRELHKSRYALIDERNQVFATISSAVTDYERAAKQYKLYETGIVPQAQQTVQSMLAGYQVSEVDFLNLVRSQMTLLNYELQYWKSLSDANEALARLMAAVGEESVYE
jgi:outer membrane protein, heavy metal efflux system